MAQYDIASLERVLDNAEYTDCEAHKLYNNLGLAYAAKRDFRRSLKAHREEKKICKRLLSLNPDDTTRHLDLAIAYRRCGDAMIKLDRLIDNYNRLLTARDDIIHIAQSQHRKGFNIAQSAPVKAHTRPAVRLEMQAASAALAQSTLALALQTHEHAHFADAADASVRAARLAERLIVGHAGLSHSAKQSLLLGIALNHAIALSGLGEKKRARTLFQTVAVRATALDDQANLVRAFSNLGEEAGEDNEWKLSEAYVREWVRHARREEDHCDEADALRKLAVILRETGDLRGAEEALQRALALPGSDEGQREAESFLNVIQQDIEEFERAQYQYSSFQRSAESSRKEGDYVEEAKSRLASGNCAFTLRKYDKTVEMLSRYFELVDDFGCDPVITGLEEGVHNAAIANMGESLWKLKRFEEAVKWATRELSVYDGDLPGQAQAWCNLGVYLDDWGKKEKAIDALKQSAEIARQCGELDTMTRAEDNLQLVEQELEASKELVSEFDASIANGSRVKGFSSSRDAPTALGEINTGRGGEHALKRKHVENSSRNDNHKVLDFNAECSGEKSIIMVSTQAAKKTKSFKESNQQEDAESSCDMKQTCASTRRSMHGGQRGEASISLRSREANEESSSKKLSNIVDLPKEYRLMSGKIHRRGGRVRPMIISAFRDLSSELLSREACGQYRTDAAHLNLSGLLVDNDDFSTVFDTLSMISNEHDVFVDISLNPLIPASAYDCLLSKKLKSFALHAVKQLDFSCAGVTADTLRKLSECLKENGSLEQVVSLNLSKNALGRYGDATGIAFGKLIAVASKLRSLDMSLNMLSNSFLVSLVSSLEKNASREEHSISVLQSIDLSLNNRRAPTALLETFNTREVTEQFAALFKQLPELEIINVRACGASLSTRKALRALSDSYVDFSRVIVTVSDEIRDGDV